MWSVIWSDIKHCKLQNYRTILHDMRFTCHFITSIFNYVGVLLKAEPFCMQNRKRCSDFILILFLALKFDWLVFSIVSSILNGWEEDAI